MISQASTSIIRPSDPDFMSGTAGRRTFSISRYCQYGRRGR